MLSCGVLNGFALSDVFCPMVKNLPVLHAVLIHLWFKSRRLSDLGLEHTEKVC